MIISVDNGNAYTKTPNVSFPSGVVKLDSKPIINTGDILEYNGNYYSLVNERLTYEKDKTNNEYLSILTLFAIAKELLYTKQKFHQNRIILAVGLPPGHYALLKDKFINYFKSMGKGGYIKFKYNEKEFNIILEKVYVFPQGFAAVAPKALEIKKYSRAYIIDIGGYTVDTLLLINGKPDMSCVDSLEVGIIPLYNTIKKKVSILHDIKIEESDIKELMSSNSYNNVLSDNEEIKNIINEEASKHANEILNQLREKGIDLKSSYGIFVGGGSLLLYDYIRKSNKVNKLELLSDTKANAQGYFSLAERLEDYK